MKTTRARPVTLHDVARAAGVSPITASRALGNPGLVSAATIARVQQAVASTGYVPNRLAGGLRSRRSMTVAALVPVISVPQFLPTVQALTEALDAQGYQLLLGQTGYGRAREEALLDRMLGRRVDAVVSAGLLARSAAALRLRDLGVPVVETWDMSDQPLDLIVGFSHLKVGSAVAAYFKARGWRRVAIATADDERAMLRCRGFRTAMGCDVDIAVVPAPSNLASGRRALAELLQREPRLEAVHCSSDGLAQGVMIEARARGLSVPGDLAICGFGGAPFAEHLDPALTTVHVDGAEIGRLAASMLLARCRGEPVERRAVDVGFKIVERASTATSGRS